MKKTILANGLPVYLVPVKGTRAASILVLFKVGSRHEHQSVSGAAHFIEHLMFKGTKRRPDTLTITKELDSVGASFNAFTGKDHTGYYVKIDAAKIDKAIDLLGDMLFHSKFEPAEMKREKSVIIEEINMYEDNPMMYAEDLLEQVMFEGNTLGWEIAGSRQTVAEMKRREVLAFRDQYYVPERMVVAVAGKVDQRVLSQVAATFGKIKPAGSEPGPFSPFGDLPKTKRPRVRIQTKPSEQIQIALGFPGYAINDKQAIPAGLLSIILGGNMSSRLFLAVRERRGLAYFVRTSLTKYEDTGAFVIRSGLDNSRLAMAAKVIWQELNKVKRYGVTAEELKRAKDYAVGVSYLAMEDSLNYAEWYAKQELFRDKVKSLEEHLAEVRRVNQRQIKAAANEMFDFDRLSIAAIGPYQNAAALLKHFPV